MKTNQLFLSAALLAAGFASCKKDDKGTGPSNNVGKQIQYPGRFPAPGIKETPIISAAIFLSLKGNRS
jgi:hypothetical protein